MVAGTNSTRVYRTSIRRGEARPAILAAGSRLFAEHGYLATSIEDIASAAGVARPTIFTAAGGKPQILSAVIDLALAGGEAPMPVAERAWFQEVLAEPDPRRMLALHARNQRVIGGRVADLYVAAEAAAASDPAIGELWNSLQEQRLTSSQLVAASLVAKTPLRGGYDEDAVAETLWSIASPMAYRRLVRERGWSPDRFERWQCDLLCRTFLPD